MSYIISQLYLHTLHITTSGSIFPPLFSFNRNQPGQIHPEEKKSKLDTKELKLSPSSHQILDKYNSHTLRVQSGGWIKEIMNNVHICPRRLIQFHIKSTKHGRQGHIDLGMR